jgi:general secretion pathway protein C
VTTPKDEREPHCYFTNARIVPAFRDGQGVGLKLFNIQPDSMYAKAGLRNGDVVMSLNGMPLSPAQKALETYEKVKTAPKIDAEVERDGKRLHLTYVVVRKDK